MIVSVTTSPHCAITLAPHLTFDLEIEMEHEIGISPGSRCRRRWYTSGHTQDEGA